MTRLRRKTPLKDLLPDEESRTLYRQIQREYKRNGVPFVLTPQDFSMEFEDLKKVATQFCADYPDTQFFIKKHQGIYRVAISKQKKPTP
jgi:hypothetical protein